LRVRKGCMGDKEGRTKTGERSATLWTAVWNIGLSKKRSARRKRARNARGGEDSAAGGAARTGAVRTIGGRHWRAFQKRLKTIY